MYPKKPDNFFVLKSKRIVKKNSKRKNSWPDEYICEQIGKASLFMHVDSKCSATEQRK